jgi:hypothetical protein
VREVVLLLAATE